MPNYIEKELAFTITLNSLYRVTEGVVIVAKTSIIVIINIIIIAKFSLFVIKEIEAIVETSTFLYVYFNQLFIVLVIIALRLNNIDLVSNFNKEFGKELL